VRFNKKYNLKNLGEIKMPVMSLDIVGKRDGNIFYPTAQEVTNLQNIITNNMLEVLSSNFPNQLGFVDYVDPETGLNQYDIAKQEVHDGFPGYIVVAANQAAYPTTVYTTNIDTNNSITVLADIRIVELALDETIQDAMTASLTHSIQFSLDSYYPDLNINVSTSMLTGNVDISLPAEKNVGDFTIDGVISAMTRTSADGSDNVSFHDFLWGQILTETNAQGLNLHLQNKLNNIDGLRAGDGNDILEGSNGHDPLLSGGAGDDLIIGGGSTDVGDNIFNGGTGNDILIASGNKTSQFTNHQHEFDITIDTLATIINSVSDDAPGRSYNIFEFENNSGKDEIYNFHASTDKIQLNTGINGSNITDIASLVQHIIVSGDDLSIDLGDDNTLTLVGVDVAGLNANSVIFA